ncbi:MAG: carbohydrate kinase family protein [Lachnospiraceae bacterium]|nr:carbohydrate kinase family protein [Lachnospiraceae bacterium]
MKILVSGLLNVETTLAVREFPIPYYPIDYPFFGVSSNVSGVGYNLAKAFGALGDSVELFSFVGEDDEAERIFKHLREDGITAAGVFPTLKNTPVSVVLFDKEGKRQIYCDLKDIQEKSIDVSSDRLDAQLSACDVVAATNINFNRTLIKKAREKNKIIATDVHVLSDPDDEYNKDFMSCADLLFLSDEKLPCRPEEFLPKLEEKYHNRLIVMGMGGKGAMLLDAEKQKLYMLSAVKCKQVVNTVGAGDALFSAFIHYYIKGLGPIEALKRAQTFASIKIGFNGASLGFSDEETVEKAYENARIDVTELTRW